MIAVISSVPPRSTDRVETTLSLAIKPAIRDVEILQSPNPSGANIGAMNPAITASMLSWESLTILSLKSNVCRNHTTMAAINITVKAL